MQLARKYCGPADGGGEDLIICGAHSAAGRPGQGGGCALGRPETGSATPLPTVEGALRLLRSNSDGALNFACIGAATPG